MLKVPIVMTVVLGVFGLAVSVPAKSQSRAAVPNPASPPLQGTTSYAAKFVCGVQQDRDIAHVVDAQAGRYSTKINVHNSTGIVIYFRKKVIRLRGGEVPLSPAANKPLEKLSEDQAMEVVCADIYKLLGIIIQAGKIPPFIEGFVILEVYYQFDITVKPPPDPLDVQGVYTYRGELPATPLYPASDSGVSIEVVVFSPKNNAHPLGGGQPQSAEYPTKEECEAQEVGRQCIQLSNGTWHAE